MAQTKVTFALDEQTIRRLGNSARRANKPKSAVVREALADYHERIGRLSEAERLSLLTAIDQIASRPVPRRSESDVDQEIAAVRKARRGPGRRHSS
ncbi:MAG TPA: ribbon-helix-helix protein, CopG family [Thermoanaerobaculia bacterium]